MVVGGCGDYFDVADTVVMMEDYIPRDATLQAKAVAEEIPSSLPDDDSALFRKVAHALCCYALHFFRLTWDMCCAARVLAPCFGEAIWQPIPALTTGVGACIRLWGICIYGMCGHRYPHAFRCRPG